MPTIHEVAQRAGVSLGTVSNVLNHPELVASETRERVEQIIEELGFVRNGSARQLRTGSTQSIALMVLDVSNPFFTEVARGVEAAASKHGYLVILCNSNKSPDKEQGYLRTLEEQRVAGVLIVPTTGNTPRFQFARAGRRSGMAVVLLDRASGDAEICSVSVDDVYGGELAGHHLLELGHRRIAYIHGPLTTGQYTDRLQGLRQAIVAVGLDPDSVITSIGVEKDTPTGGKASVEELLAMADRPTALCCGNDYLAMGVMYELARRGFSIPSDFSLIGYDDIDLAPMLVTPLTTIRQPKYDLGYAAAELLFDEIARKNTHAHRHVVFRPELVVRQSTQARHTRR